ncbi:MAG: MopE-related protein [Polyangiaceae bacterium]|nr:MopE-related protein [Polyangiaceae bacterium]
MSRLFLAPVLSALLLLWPALVAASPCPGNPTQEVCDGVDNDCNDLVDDGAMPLVGAACGASVGQCKPGVLVCSGGVIDCAGAVMPSPEVCDGLDNDCDGTPDNNVPVQGPCAVPYDTVAFPGDRSKGACSPGALLCGADGNVSCEGGVAPAAEICDGVDNDCDGLIDEPGPAPDGIDGSVGPQAPPGAQIGDACGVATGECLQGAYACGNGAFLCIGQKGPVDEVCDGKDNDCDGVVDGGVNGVPPCPVGNDCVKAVGGFWCAAPCSDQTPCAAGSICRNSTGSDGTPLGGYCIPDLCHGGCDQETVLNAQFGVACTPAGTPPNPTDCTTPPVCVCSLSKGCVEPCDGVTCGFGMVCRPDASGKGTCVLDTCHFTGCKGCGLVCDLGSCVANPCGPTSCPDTESCVPSADFSTFSCVPSCADVACAAGEACVKGACVADCAPGCDPGSACDRASLPPQCKPNLCPAERCDDGSYCDPLTGACRNDPCAGVVCPASQLCKGGSCFSSGAMGGAGGGAGAGGSAGAAGGSGPGGEGGAAGTAGAAAGSSGTGGSSGEGGSGQAGTGQSGAAGQAGAGQAGVGQAGAGQAGAGQAGAGQSGAGQAGAGGAPGGAGGAGASGGGSGGAGAAAGAGAQGADSGDAGADEGGCGCRTAGGGGGDSAALGGLLAMLSLLVRRTKRLAGRESPRRALCRPVLPDARP